jgi:predicted O-linked N-acetylglucosamine transferase (SPINDLY family)
VLIDLSGHTAGNRLLAFARQPAPVQITWLGYFNTTGLTAMHYLVGDAVVTPPEEAGLFTEEVLRLPGAYLCYQRPAYALPPDRADGPLTFGCFNALSKITPAVIACWARILEAAPEARLLLKNHLLTEEATRRSVEERFATHGIDGRRLLLEPGCPHRELLGHYARVDVALDPFPYNGGTTTCEALTQGVPVVTLRGNQFVSRVGATILRQAGLTEWIADTPAQYVEIALQLARAAHRRDRAALIAHVAASPLADAAAFTRHLETAFRNAWRRWCETHG